MDQARPALPFMALFLLALAYATLPPGYGSPNPAVMIAVLLASLASSIAGFAFSAICGAMLFHLCEDPVEVVQIMMICSIANQASMVLGLRRDIDWRGLSVFLIGGVFGLPIGLWALLHADRHLYTHAIGAFLLIYGSYVLLSRPRTSRWQHPALDVVVGFLGGITGGAAGFPSATVAIWCGLRGWDKTRQRALFQPFILVMQVAALIALSVLAHQQRHMADSGFTNLLYIPAGLLGTCLGMACFRRMSNRQFTIAVNLLLIVSGISFVL